jgi:glycerol-3-phosphate dehydrogenase
LARRTRLAFLNVQAGLEALPVVIDLMAEELKWDSRRKDMEWKDAVGFLVSMGLPKSRIGVTRRDVESGKAGTFNESERKLYSRHGMHPAKI